MKNAVEMYSYLPATRVFSGIAVDPVVPTPSTQSLQRIEDALADAAADLAARRYQDAIQGFRAAEAMVARLLTPRVRLDIVDRAALRAATVFDDVLDVATEFLNVLPIELPDVPVRPRDPIDPGLLKEAERYMQLGVTAERLSGQQAIDAFADVRAGQALLDAGNPKGAEVLFERARSADADLVERVDLTAPRTERVAERVERRADMPVMHTMSARTITLPGAERLSSSVVADLANERSAGTLICGDVARFTWPAGAAVPRDDVRVAIYEKRRALVDLTDIVVRPLTPADVALYLPHAYYYVIPLGLAECYHALGQWTDAEREYLEAASYAYLNATVEAPYVWTALATLYLDWGDSLFRDDDAPKAADVYAKVIALDGTVPAGSLYTIPGLAPAADQARLVIGDLANAATLAVLPSIASVVVEVWKQILKIEAGLDFWGFWAPTVPIWTFEFLQGVSVNFAQLAISSERDVIQFWDRADAGTLTREQLKQNSVQTKAELDAAKAQALAAAAEQQVYQDGAALAQLRANNANTAVVDYTSKSRLAILYAAESAQVAGGDDGDAGEINEQADKFLSGQTISGDRGMVTAAVQLAGAKMNREYEIGALQRQAAEMAAAKVQADDEVKAAAARTAAANAGVTAATIRAQGAQSLLDAFDAQFFTPDVWRRMGDTMYRLYRRYLFMAVRSARLMQRAYNFETDQSISLIRSDYSSDEVKGLLAADMLMADIQTFTFDLITSQVGKPQPVKQTISLAGRYPYAFETQFRSTGVLEFETRPEDFDSVHPGTWGQRLDAVEVAFEGLVPATGIVGTLENSGISMYRVPSRSWTNPATTGLQYRIQSKETLVLSDYSMRQDMVESPQDNRMLRLFQGAGVMSTWRLEVPRGVNDLDFEAITDVKITMYYQARFDTGLTPRVRSWLAALPGLHARDLALPLRWLYPDAYFRFQDTGDLEISLARNDFPAYETKPKIESVGILVATTGGLSPAGIAADVGVPGMAPVSGTTDADGALDSTGALSTLVGGDAIGDYVVTISAADRSRIANVVLLLGYSYTPRV